MQETYAVPVMFGSFALFFVLLVSTIFTSSFRFAGCPQAYRVKGRWSFVCVALLGEVVALTCVAVGYFDLQGLGPLDSSQYLELVQICLLFFVGACWTGIPVWFEWAEITENGEVAWHPFFGRGWSIPLNRVASVNFAKFANSLGVQFKYGGRHYSMKTVERPFFLELIRLQPDLPFTDAAKWALKIRDKDLEAEARGQGKAMGTGAAAP